MMLTTLISRGRDSLRADIHLNVLDKNYGRMYL